MSTLHQQLYAYLAGQVDDAITYLEDMIDQQAFDWAHTIQVTELLKSALRTAEERYIEAEGE